MTIFPARDEIFRRVHRSMICRKRNDVSVFSNFIVEECEKFAELAVESHEIVHLLETQWPEPVSHSIGH